MLARLLGKVGRRIEEGGLILNGVNISPGGFAIFALRTPKGTFGASISVDFGQYDSLVDPVWADRVKWRYGK